MIRLFGEASKTPDTRLWAPLKSVFGNMVAAAFCAAVSFVWFGVAFAVGDSPLSDDSSTAKLFLWASVLVVAALGVVLGSVLRQLPWLAILLTPFFLGTIMRLSGGRDSFTMGLRLGCYISVVYLGGTLAGKGVKRLMSKPLL